MSNRATKGKSLVGALAVGSADGLDVNGVIVSPNFRITVILDAADVDRWAWIADRACEVVLIEEVHSVVGGASAAVRPRKVLAASTAAPGAAAGANVKELTTATIDLTAAIDTTQTPALTATTADRKFADGDRLGLDFSGTLTGLKGVLVLTFKPI